MNRSFVMFFTLSILLVSLISIGCHRAPEPEPVPPTPIPTETPLPSPTPVPTQSPEEIRMMKLQEAESILSSADIFFDFDRANLTEEAKSILAEKAQYLIQNSDIKVIIEGHCDSRGSNEYNLALGERRAAGAKKYLVTYGVDETMIETVTYGEERPVCFEQTESCWSQNRRAHFTIEK